MNTYAQSMRDMLARVGQPAVTKTTVQPPKQKLDIGSLIAMLMMMGDQFSKPDVSDPSNIINPMEILGPMGSGGAFGGMMEGVPGTSPNPTAPGTPFSMENMGMGAGAGITPSLLMRILTGMRGR